MSGRNPPRQIPNNQPPSADDEQQEIDRANVVVNDNANRDLKYLLAQLRACRNEPEKAKSLLQYLSGCGFNAGESPDRVIRFSNDEARELARYVAEIDGDDVDGVEEPGVRQIYYVSDSLFVSLFFAQKTVQKPLKLKPFFFIHLTHF